MRRPNLFDKKRHISLIKVHTRKVVLETFKTVKFSKLFQNSVYDASKILNTFSSMNQNHKLTIWRCVFGVPFGNGFNFACLHPALRGNIILSSSLINSTRSVSKQIVTLYLTSVTFALFPCPCKRYFMVRWSVIVSRRFDITKTSVFVFCPTKIQT